MLTIYIFKRFKGHWPVGTCALVIAEDAIAAIVALERELEGRGLSLGPDFEITHTFDVDSLVEPEVHVLLDGNY